VAKDLHSDRLVAAMRRQGLSVDYREPTGMGHCGPFDWLLLRRLAAFVSEPLRTGDEVSFWPS
jgi:hypothetical protein